MTRLRDLAMLARLTRDSHGFLSAPISAARAVKVVQEQLKDRERRFLEVARETIYAHPESPYRELLREAGCAFDDLKDLVAREGLEGALSALAAAGVYVTFDEFKGRRQAVRGSRRFQFADVDFDNP
ncbi:MAG TPA: hypothetical protein VJP78_09855, partial [Thermoleophilia bacterium]|nr:hypothetical protein [Thermoleophilia bacterium]